MSKHFTNIKVKELPDSEVEITGEISAEHIESTRKEALRELNKRTELPGFRAGHVPEDVLVKKLGEMRILEEAAELVIGREYAHIMEDAKVIAIGRPSVAITKLAPGIPLEFKITTAIEPTFDLPDYKKVAKDISSESEPMNVEEKEIDDVLEEIKKRDWKPDLAEGEDLREKVKENILREKELRVKEKRRLGIVQALIKATEISVPRILVDTELEKMMSQFKGDVTRMGLKWEDYLASIKKSEEEVRGEWREKALDRAKADLIIAKIAVTEKIEPSVEELEKETAHLLTHVKDADPLHVRIYVYTMMRNEKVLEFLESTK